MASYEPRMYPGWPHADLHALANLLPDLPGVPQPLREQSNDLKLFARNAEEWEEARRTGSQEARLLEENATHGLQLPDGALHGAAKILTKP
jgi:hypothetical protein